MGSSTPIPSAMVNQRVFLSYLSVRDLVIRANRRGHSVFIGSPCAGNIRWAVLSVGIFRYVFSSIYCNVSRVVAVFMVHCIVFLV